MKNRVQISLLVIACACMLGTSSCKKALDNLADLNTNENQPLKASSPTLLSAAEFSGIMYDQGSFAYNNDGDGFLGIFAQHFAGNHAEGVNYNGYILTHSDFQYLFNDAYVSSLMNLKQLTINALPNEQSYVGIAKVLEAYQLGYLTAIYGDIPWSQSLDVTNYPNPKYDAQVDIYAAVQTLLSDGITFINAGSTIKGDIIYQGNLSKWKAAAYLLKARYYNHFSKKNPTGSATSALLMVDSAKLAGFTTNGTAGDFTLPYDGLTGATTNPWVGMWNNSMLVANLPFLDSLISQKDPRLNAYFTSTNFNKVNVYGLGKVISSNVGTGNYMYIGADSYSYFGKATSNVELATYPELLMIEAEAALRLGNTSRAATAHNAAIAAQLNTVVSLASDKAKIAAYITQYASETAATISLQKVMTEKHKLMFTMEAESWMDVRRMGNLYPSWLSIPVVDESATQAVPVASSYIQRLLYPQSELDKNTANVPKTTIYDKLPILQ